MIKYLTEKEVAKIIGMSMSYLSHRRSNGKLKGQIPGPPFLRIGRNIRYAENDLKKWMEQFIVNT
jgi:predicted DNA-binding transcriptional regulator AlpA